MSVTYKIIRDLKRNGVLYLFVIPGLVCFTLFVYAPMVGVISSFQSYNLIKGIFGSKFIGLDNFKILFGSPVFLLTLKNTLLINLLKILFIFPVPIIFSLLFNEVKNVKFKRINQTISYMPFFVSWVVVAGLWTRILSPYNGVINDMLNMLHLTNNGIYFLGDSKYFYPIIILQELWKNLGYSSIFYIAALASVDKQLYDSAYVDGANRFQRILHVSLPRIFTTILLLFILNLANVLNANFEQIQTMMNPNVMNVGDVIDTYVFRVLTTGSPRDIGVGAALGFMKGIVGFLLFFIANKVMYKTTQRSFL